MTIMGELLIAEGFNRVKGGGLLGGV